MGQWLRFHVYTAGGGGACVQSLAGNQDPTCHMRQKKTPQKFEILFINRLFFALTFKKYCLKILYIMFIMVFDASS